MNNIMENEDVFIGIDPGLRNTGYACLSKDKNPHSYNNGTFNVIAYGTISTDPKNDRPLQKIYSILKTLINDFKPKMVFLESTFVNINSRTSLKLMSGYSTIKVLLENLNIKSMSMQSSRIKKNVIGRGNALKSDIAEYLKANFNIVCSEHEGDAIIIALCGLNLMNKNTTQ